MTRTGWMLFILTALIMVAAIVLFLLPGKTSAPAAQNNQQAAATAPTIAQVPDMLVVQSLYDGSAISSPLTITGVARGLWYFEATFPVEIEDASGTVIAQGPAQAQSDWMTQDFVPFRITLAYPAQPAGSQGNIVLKKDNPSGDPANDNQLVIPILFK